MTTNNAINNSANSISFSPSTNGIVGTTTNNNASSGYVGEFVSSHVAFPGNSISNNTQTNLTSISLTAGDWDVYGSIVFNNTSYTQVYAGISLVSATFPDDSLIGLFEGTTSGTISLMAPYTRISIANTTTVYLVGECVFSAGSSNFCGILSARRAR